MTKVRVLKSDADGYLSSALVLNYIYALWPSAIDKFTWILHEKKIHGIEVNKLPKDVTLVLVPDASSNEYEIHQKLQEQGIDVVCLDHHHTDKYSEYACVVNNQMCNYPTKSLCGCAIVYKLFQYIDSILKQEGFVDQFLDIVSVSLISDMMDVRDFETRYLINQGLYQIRNPFIKGMVEKNSYSIGDQVTPIGITFYVTPLINAITRVGTMEEKELLFESMLDWKAGEYIPSTKRGHKGEQETRLEQSLRTCTNVKKRQTKLQDAAVEMIEDKIEKECLLDNKILIICLDEASFDRGITGLIANKIMAKYQTPTLLLIKGMDRDRNIIWSGSGRGPGACGLDDFRGFCQDSGYCYLAQGHQRAFGFGIKDENLQDFIDYSNQALADINFTPDYKVDYIYSTETLTPENILNIGGLKSLWGQELPEALIVIENLRVTKDMITLMSRDRNPTLKIQLNDEISCIKFKSNEEEFEELNSQGAVTINIVGKCEVNHYFNRVQPQIIIQDYEIISRQEFYF